MGDLQGIVRGMRRDQLTRYLPWLINTLLVIFLINTIVTVTLRWMSPDSEPASAATANTPAPAVVNRQQAVEIAQLHLFGNAVQQGEAQTPTVAPETKLNLVLSGVIASNRAEDEVAIIGPRGGREQGYAIGDRLPGGAVLKEIYEDRVILQHAGRLETLTLQRKLLDDTELQIQK